MGKITLRSVSTRRLMPVLAFLASSGGGFGATSSYDFNGTGIQAGDSLRGSAVITNNELQLTTATNSLTARWSYATSIPDRNSPGLPVP
jgi:hypothetical protein